MCQPPIALRPERIFFPSRCRHRNQRRCTQALQGAPGAGAASGVPGGAGAGAAAQGTPPAWRLGLAVPGVTVPAGDALPLWLATAAALAVHEAGALPPNSALSKRTTCQVSQLERRARPCVRQMPGLAWCHLQWRTTCLHPHSCTLPWGGPAGRACSGGSRRGRAAAKSAMLPSARLQVHRQRRQLLEEGMLLQNLNPCPLGPGRQGMQRRQRRRASRCTMRPRLWPCCCRVHGWRWRRARSPLWRPTASSGCITLPQATCMLGQLGSCFLAAGTAYREAVARRACVASASQPPCERRARGLTGDLRRRVAQRGDVCMLLGGGGSAARAVRSILRHWHRRRG